MMKNLTHLKHFQNLITFSVVIALVVVFAGCASTPPPTEQIALSKAAIANATEAGGNEYAPIQLKSAMDKMTAAQQAMDKKDYDVARQLAEQAQVDAKLAAATARSAKAKKAAEALQESNRVLQQEIQRNTN